LTAAEEKEAQELKKNGGPFSRPERELGIPLVI